MKSKVHLYESKKWLESNDFILSIVDGIVPIMFEYENCYLECKNRLKTIPIPMNVEEIPYSENVVRGKIVVFHGLSRYGFKGTRFVEEAFEILREKYGSEAEFIIDGQMPLNEYLLLMKKTNIVIDQTNSYSLGVNGVYALAMGKVVLGGAEPESLKSFGISESPVINILPDVGDIVDKIGRLIEEKDSLRNLGVSGRMFAENLHSYKLVAEEYVKVWMSIDK